jgi:ATP-dependent Clp protease, protease subunit
MVKNRLQALLIQNRQTPRSYRIEAAADAEEATVYLYDVIDEYWGVSAGQFVKDLMSIKAQTIHLRVNSPGGDVFSGRAMATAIKAHPSKVIAHIDGLAASAASYVALSADEVEIAQGAFVMIHRAWGLTMGNAEDHLDMGALLEKIDEELVADYVRETGNTAEAVRVWLDAETWFTAEEAVATGFADRIATAEAKAQARWNLAAFDRPPSAALADRPGTPADPPADPVPNPDEEAEQAHAAACRRLALIETNREAYPA